MAALSSRLVSPMMAMLLVPRARHCMSAARGTPLRPKAKQSLGQNFLQDERVAQRICASLQRDVGASGERVVELGPGQGALTRWLLDAYPQMTAVEIDSRMVELLHEKWPLLTLQHADLLSLELEALAAQKEGRLAIVSNTPFYLTSQLLFKLTGAVESVDEVR